MLSPASLSEEIMDQCMHLTALLLGQYDFRELSHPVHEYWCPFENFAIRFDEVFPKQLLELAALARANLDLCNDISSNPSVGNLIAGSKTQILPFREACNKIIHAQTLDVNYRWTPEHPLDNGRNGYAEPSSTRFKNPIVRTTGNYKSSNWQAEIYFLKYIDVLKGNFS